MTDQTAQPGLPQDGQPAPAPATTLIDRTFGHLRATWRDIAASARGALGGTARPYPPRESAERLKSQVQACLEGRGGVVSARARAAELGRTYLGLDAAGRRNFLRMLARDFDVDRAEVDRVVAQFHDAADARARGEAERCLRQALEPGRMRLLTQFNVLPEGVKFLVDMRSELMTWSRDDPELAALEADLKGLLTTWFDVGFLDLRRITWDSPASLLEKLIAYEAVHEIRGWQDLKDRLDSDRRCFAFFHPRMPAEPLIFVEVALVSGLSDTIHALLDETAPVQDARLADTATFYSISNAQRGLAGISFGNFLIKRVVDSLTTEFPNLRYFATLSPVPGFCRWLARRLGEQGDGLLSAAELQSLTDAAAGIEIAAVGVLAGLMARTPWHRDDALARVLKAPLMRLCAQYLAVERNGRRVLDPVAHFHLSNGASIDRLNWLADVSDKGIRQSAGIMVNYRYKLDVIEANHEAYAGEGRVTTGAAFRALL